MPDPTAFRSPLAEAAVWRAVQLIEEDGPLDDAAALRQAMALRSDDRGRLIERAWFLGQRLGLVREWERWRQLAGWMLVALALAVALGAALLAGAVLGEAREINALAAFCSLLGLHALTWLLWFASLFVHWSGGSGLGRVALQLTARLPLDRGPHALQLARATSDVLGRARLAPWFFGGISHLVWSLSFLVLLGGLALGFSLRAYRLGWETTILTPGFFIDFVHVSGWLPSRLFGFPEPDAAALLAAPGSDARDWAWWLIGCVAVYGFGLRAISGLVCALVWRQQRSCLSPDLADPYARRLLARFAALAPAEVLDEEQPGGSTAHSRPTLSKPDGTLAIGFELPPEANWPDQRISGTQEEREKLLQTLAAAPPRRLLFVCHPPSSPDRGTARLLREAAAMAGATALLLAGDTGRWRDWLATSGLNRIELFGDRDAALAWLDPS